MSVCYVDIFVLVALLSVESDDLHKQHRIVRQQNTIQHSKLGRYVKNVTDITNNIYIYIVYINEMSLSMKCFNRRLQNGIIIVGS